MLPSILKSSKPIYFYDKENKELIYIASSQRNMCEVLGIVPSNMAKYTKFPVSKSIYLFIRSVN